MDKISVIIPVYKVEEYLDKCVESVVNQTYENLEIILVDDGSPDNCPKMCDEWAQKDKRIKVIHKENGGVSSARNNALEKVTGDYICFVDSDDTIHPMYIEILLKNLKESKADISVCNWKKVYDINNPQNKEYKEKQKSLMTFEGNEVFDLLYNKKVPLIMALWTKLYKKEIFENIRFPEVVIAEDDAIIHLVLSNCKKLVYSNYTLYNNTQRGNSLTASSFSKKKLHALKVFKSRIEFIEKNNSDFLNQSIHHYIRILILYYHYAKWSKMEKEVLDLIKEEINLYIEKGYVSRITKMFIKHPKILNIVLKIRQKLV